MRDLDVASGVSLYVFFCACLFAAYFAARLIASRRQTK
jgi:hypothetical protein